MKPKQKHQLHSTNFHSIESVSSIFGWNGNFSFISYLSLGVLEKWLILLLIVSSLSFISGKNFARKMEQIFFKVFTVLSCFVKQSQKRARQFASENERKRDKHRHFFFWNATKITMLIFFSCVCASTVLMEMIKMWHGVRVQTLIRTRKLSNLHVVRMASNLGQEKSNVRKFRLETFQCV